MNSSASAKNAGKWWGTVSGSPEHTQKLFDPGAKFICHGADLIMVKQGMEQILRAGMKSDEFWPAMATKWLPLCATSCLQNETISGVVASHAN